MHLIIGTRGNQESVELFIKELSSKYVPVPFRNKKTDKIVNVAQGIHVRPFQLWEIIFPKEQRDLVLSTIFSNKNTKVSNPKFRKLYKWLLKLLPFKKMPEDWDDSKHLMVMRNDVEIVGLGMLDDKMADFTGRTDAQMKSIGLDPKAEWEFESL